MLADDIIRDTFTEEPSVSQSEEKSRASRDVHVAVLPRHLSVASRRIHVSHLGTRFLHRLLPRHRRTHIPDMCQDRIAPLNSHPHNPCIISPQPQPSSSPLSLTFLLLDLDGTALTCLAFTTIAFLPPPLASLAAAAASASALAPIATTWGAGLAPTAGVADRDEDGPATAVGGGEGAGRAGADWLPVAMRLEVGGGGTGLGLAVGLGGMPGGRATWRRGGGG